MFLILFCHGESMSKFSFITTMAALASMLATSVIADPYIGAGAGRADYKVNLTSLGGPDFKENGTGTKFYGGYAFNKYFAVEAAYYNFAEASVAALETSPGSGNFVSAAADMKGFGGYAVGMYPVNKKFNLIAKLGLLKWSADLRLDDKKASNDGTDAAFGVGASYAFTKELIGVAEWESFE